MFKKIIFSSLTLTCIATYGMDQRPEKDFFKHLINKPIQDALLRHEVSNQALDTLIERNAPQLTEKDKGLLSIGNSRLFKIRKNMESKL